MRWRVAQPACVQVLFHKMLGHPAPSKAREQEIHAPPEIDEPPRSRAGQAVVRPVPVRRVGQNKLNMGLQIDTGCRTPKGRQRVVRCGHGQKVDPDERRRHDILRHVGQQQAKGKRHIACAQTTERASKSLGREADLQLWMGLVQRAKTVDQGCGGDQRIDGQRQFRLHPLT